MECNVLVVVAAVEGNGVVVVVIYLMNAADRLIQVIAVTIVVNADIMPTTVAFIADEGAAAGLVQDQEVEEDAAELGLVPEIEEGALTLNHRDAAILAQDLAVPAGVPVALLGIVGAVLVVDQDREVEKDLEAPREMDADLDLDQEVDRELLPLCYEQNPCSANNSKRKFLCLRKPTVNKCYDDNHYFWSVL